MLGVVGGTPPKRACDRARASAARVGKGIFAIDPSSQCLASLPVSRSASHAGVSATRQSNQPDGRERMQSTREGEAIDLWPRRRSWIASSLTLLAMTARVKRKCSALYASREALMKSAPTPHPDLLPAKRGEGVLRASPLPARGERAGRGARGRLAAPARSHSPKPLIPPFSPLAGRRSPARLAPISRFWRSGR